MAKAKVAQIHKQNDLPNSVAPLTPELQSRDYFLSTEQLNSLRHLVHGAQGLRREFEQVKLGLGAIAGLFGGISIGLATVLEEIQDQKITEGGAA